MKILLLLWILLFSYNLASGCTCAVINETEREAIITNLSTVFYGEVLSKEKKIIYRVGERNNIERVVINYKFRVEEFWKGVNSEEVIIQTEVGSCEVKFEIGQKTFVLAHQATGILPRVDYCSEQLINPISSTLLSKNFGESKTLKEENFIVRLWQRITSFFS